MNTFIPAYNFPNSGNHFIAPVFIFTGGDMKDLPEKKGHIYPAGNNQPQRTLHIIMADDDEDDRDLFQEAIEKSASEIKLEFAEDGRCLLDILANGKVIPDLIFLDLNMPHKSGMECLTEIRKNEKWKNIPIVIYSTSSSIRDINETFDKGANLYIKKPSSFGELQRITSKVLSLDWNNYLPFSSRSQFLFSSKTE